MNNSILLAIHTKYENSLSQIKDFLEGEKAKENIDSYTIRYSKEIDAEIEENQEDYVIKYYSDFPAHGFLDFVKEKIEKFLV